MVETCVSRLDSDGFAQQQNANSLHCVALVLTHRAVAGGAAPFGAAAAAMVVAAAAAAVAEHRHSDILSPFLGSIFLTGKRT